MKLLKIASWKIFALLILVPTGSIIIGAMLSKLTGYNNLSTFASIIFVLSICLTYFGWIWTAGINILKLRNEDSIFSITTFKRLLIGAISYSFMISPILRTTFPGQFESLNRFLSILSFLCFLLCIYFIATNLVAVKKKEGNKHSILTTFLSIWILPIGIWFIQPRIKKLILQSADN